MPVPAYPGPNTATGNGVTTVFPYSFPILAEADLRVSVDDVVKTLTTHYTISGVGESSGGNVTFLSAPANGAAVVIERSRAYTRTTDYQRNGAFDEQTVDADFDAAIMLIQQLREITRRIPQLAAGTTLLDLALPSPGAGEYLRWNVGGTALETVDLVGQLTGTPAVSAFMATLLDDASARAGRQTLLTHKKGSDVASAGTIDLDTTTGDVVDVTGTTTITAITLSEGEERTVRFTGALTLTHGASLVLPGSASITTTAGDVAVFRGYAAGVVRCTSYQRIDGGAPRGGWVLLAEEAASASSTVDFVTADGLNATYDQYMVTFTKVKPATDDVYLGLRIGTGAGPTYQTANYQYAARMSGPSAGADVGSASDDRIALSRTGAGQGVGSAAGELIHGVVYFEHPTDTTDYHVFRAETGYIRSDAAIVDYRGSGTYGGAAAAMTGLRFLFSSGNIASGTFRLYGLRK